MIPAAKAGPIAVIAGAGGLPAEVAAEIAAGGSEVVVLPLRGIAKDDFPRFRCETVDALDPLGTIAVLRRLGAAGVVMAGSVHRPSAGLVLAGWQAVRNNEEIRRIVDGGDDNLLRGIIDYLEGNGFPVLSLSEVAPRLMAGQGLLAGPAPSAASLADIERGFAVLMMMGPGDIGQALAISSLRVLAVEAAEGTDAMIRRVRTLRRPGVAGRLLRAWRPPLADRTGGVLVKAAKPGQDFRADLPAIGLRTVRLAAASGLAGIAVEAGTVLIVEQRQALAAAERAGLFIWGVAR